MSGRSTTGSKTACAPTSSSACSPIISNGTCASAWPSCSTTTPTRRPPRRSARARSQRLSDRPPPSPSRPQAEPTMVSPSTASTPCFTTSPPSPKTPSRPPSRPTSPSQSPHGRHTSRKKPPTSWASVPSNTPIQLDLIKLEQWVAKVERGKLRLRALQWRQTALLSEAVLTALAFYIARGGGSRGAPAICAPEGDRVPEARIGALEDVRFVSERAEDRAEQIHVQFDSGAFVCTARSIRRRDRDDKPFFERDWPDFLTGAIYEEAGR